MDGNRLTPGGCGRIFRGRVSFRTNRLAAGIELLLTMCAGIMSWVCEPQREMVGIVGGMEGDNLDLMITGRHIKVTEDLREYVAAKMGKLTKHFDGVRKVQVMLSPEGERFKVELVAHAVRGMNLAAEGLGMTETEAVDAALDRMDRQVRKLKDRLKDHRIGPQGGEEGAGTTED